MKWTTSCARAASKAPSGNGRCSAEAVCTSTPGYARASGGDERLRRIDRRDGIGAKPRDQLGGEGARAAADVDHALAAAHTREVSQLRGEQDRVPAHEAVIRVSGDVEAHQPSILRP